MGKAHDPEKGSETAHRNQPSAAGLRAVLHADEKTPPELRNEPPSRRMREKSAAPLVVALVLGLAGVAITIVGLNADTFGPLIFGVILLAAAWVVGVISRRD